MSRLEELVKQMFVILDKVEMSDEGREFRPTQISSCRVMDSVRLDAILGEMRHGLGLGAPPKLRQRHEIEEGICPRCNGTGDTANHERESNDCTMCNCTGRVKKCECCGGEGEHLLELEADQPPKHIDCEECDSTGFVPGEEW